MMRAKFVYEKFSEDSDPIHDLGIGLPITRAKKGDKLKIKNTFNNVFLKYKKDYVYELQDENISTSDYLDCSHILTIIQIFKYDEDMSITVTISIKNYSSTKPDCFVFYGTYKNFDKYFEIIR